LQTKLNAEGKVRVYVILIRVRVTARVKPATLQSLHKTATMPIFNDVLYYLSQSLPPQRQQSLSTLLLANGAVQASLSKATHVVTNTRRFEGWQGVGQNVAVVTERWVERSMVLGKMQP
jgi:hypothetical protein